MAANQATYFGKIVIPQSQMFLSRKNVFGIVNLKPVTEGHVLLIPRRPVKRIFDLTEIETLDFLGFNLAKVLGKIYKTDCQIGIQDGESAGQTIEHLHCHIIPKKQLFNNLDNETREAQTEEQMTEEANKYKPYFEQNNL